jgi:GNAT superfamily N-acetyltransferase
MILTMSWDPSLPSETRRTCNIRLAETSEAGVVSHFVLDLLQELYPERASSFDEQALAETAAWLLREHTGVWALLAIAPDEVPVGVLTLNECAAIYAGGRFGTISELYGSRHYRSLGAGAQLVNAAVEFGRKRHWTRLEVGAPDVPRWQRSVDFYLGYGFRETGPRLCYLLKVAGWVLINAGDGRLHGKRGIGWSTTKSELE